MNKPIHDLTKADYQALLRNNILVITFRKVGEAENREMQCTLAKEVLAEFNPSYDPDAPPKRVQPDNQVSVWDLEKKAWRSFLTESVISYQVLPLAGLSK